VYYSAFTPVKGTALEKTEAEDPRREHRLYNADFLFREYGIKLKEIVGIMDDGMLPHEDPKLVLARQNFDGALDINQSTYDELIRVPGIGPITAKRIMAAGSVKSHEELSMLGVQLAKASPFISVEGKRQMRLGEFV
jgi:predicted DNA-binding helix-hairpin-helix protein